MGGARETLCALAWGEEGSGEESQRVVSKNKGAFRGGGLGTDPAGAGGARGCQGR